MGGAFVISLDFELHWGVRDHSTVDAYRENLLGVRDAIPAMLRLFERRAIAATWATVGFLFAENKRGLEQAFPRVLPTYARRALSPYDAMSEVGEDEARDPFHYAPSLIRRIVATPGQELATHTFSHYYCLEDGQTAEQFDADLEAAQRIAKPFGDVMASIVFPRNQLNAAYADILRGRGVRAYRSTGSHWAYRAEARETARRRAFRLLDAYAPLGGVSGHPRGQTNAGLVDVPASVFLRPYSPRLRRFDGLRLRRLEDAMTRAARRDEVFHLWWHPHNFGAHLRENMHLLERIVDHLEVLRRRHGMESLSMKDAAR